MIDIDKLTVSSAIAAMKKREFTARELLDTYIERIEKLNPKLNAFTITNFENARKSAKISDEKIASGAGGALEGIPIGVKSLYCVKDFVTDACSNILRDFRPIYDSHVTEQIWKEGGLHIGNTNMDEFAMGSTNLTSCHGAAINPLKDVTRPDIDLVPGGSSGGSASAVAASMCPVSLGTDTGGSIRQPAAFCGIVGMKPTYGRCSRFGIVGFASSLDQAGSLTKTVEDAAIMMEVICGYDSRDSTSVDLSPSGFRDVLESGVRGMRIGIPTEYCMENIDQDVLKMWEDAQKSLKAAGAIITSISLPHTSYALPVYYTIAPAEVSSNLRRYDGVRYGHRTSEKCSDFYQLVGKTRDEGFGDEVKRRIILGSYILSSLGYETYCIRAQKIRQLIVNDFHSAFHEVDAIMSPTTLTPAFGINEKIDDPKTIYFNDILTVPASLAGLPAISIPFGKNSQSGLPLGMQIIGNAFDEKSIFRVARVLEKDYIA